MFVFAVGLEVVSAPAAEAPAFGGGVFAAVLDHELDLDEGAGFGVAVGVDLLGPGAFGEGGAVGPRVDVVFGDGLHGDVVAVDDAHGVVVEAVGGADNLPVAVAGDVLDTVEGRLDVGYGVAGVDPVVVLGVGCCGVGYFGGLIG